MKVILTFIDSSDLQQDKQKKPHVLKKYRGKTCAGAGFAIILHSRFGGDNNATTRKRTLKFCHKTEQREVV